MGGKRELQKCIGVVDYLLLKIYAAIMLYDNVVRVLIGLFCCLSEMGGSSHRRSASPEYELDASKFFTRASVSSMTQGYKMRDLPFTHLIMITLLFATSLLVPNCRGCLTLL